MSCQQSLWYTNCIPYKRARTLPQRGVLGMILSCIWLGGFCTGALGNLDYLFIAITSMSTLTQSGRTCKGLIIYGSNRVVVPARVSSSMGQIDLFRIIYAQQEYLIPYNCWIICIKDNYLKLNCLLWIIIISYLKSDNRVQPNDL